MTLVTRSLFALLLVAGGCQSYQPRPLELDGRMASLAGRGVADPGVAVFADLLAGEQGATSAHPDGLTLAAAEAVLLYWHDELRRARVEARVPQVRSTWAMLWDDPSFSVDLMRTVTGGSDPWTAGLGVGITLPVSGRLHAARAIADAQARQAWMQVAVLEVELLAELRETWLTWSAEVRRIELLSAHLGRLDSVVRVVRELVTKGELDATSGLLLRIEQQRRRLDLAQSQARAAHLVRLLRVRLGLGPDHSVTLVPLALQATGDDKSAPATEALLAHPRMEAARAKYEVAEQSLRREVLRQYPDLEIGPTFEREEGQSKLGLGFGMVVPVWNRNRGGIAEAEAERDAARAAAQADHHRLLTELVEVSGELSMARARRTQLLRDVAPLVDEQLNRVRELVGLGELDSVMLQATLEQSLAVKLELLDAALAEALASVRLASLIEPDWLGPRVRELEGVEP